MLRPRTRTPPAGWTQDEDVLDTWFSSALWPFSTLGWPDDTEDLRAYYPTTVLVTGYDILFFWVVRMMLFGLYAMDGEVPFKTVAAARAGARPVGQEDVEVARATSSTRCMWIDAYGADAVRLSLLQGANPGADQAINEEWVVGARNFCTKLWNATRFALISGATVEGALPAELAGADAWILSRLHEVIAEVDALYERFEFAKIADLLYHFAWDEVCDWYIELAKLVAGRSGRAPTTRRVLGEVLDTLLRLLHPMVPFVTEQLWTALTGGESLVIAEWPAADAARADPAAEADVAARPGRGHRGAPLPLRPGRQAVAARAGPAHRRGAATEPAIRALLRLDEPGDGLHGDGGAHHRQRRGRRARPVRRDRRRGRARPAEQGPRRGREGARASTPASSATRRSPARRPKPVVAKVRDRLAAAEADLARIDAALAALPAD